MIFRAPFHPLRLYDCHQWEKVLFANKTLIFVRYFTGSASQLREELLRKLTFSILTNTSLPASFTGSAWAMLPMTPSTQDKQAAAAGAQI